jgi:hypothetical protein
VTSLYKKGRRRIPKVIEESMSIIFSVDCLPKLSSIARTLLAKVKMISVQSRICTYL